MSDELNLEVKKNPERNRYEIFNNGERIGLADYIAVDGLISFTHTETDPAYEGRGVASQLVREALDDVREDGTRKVQPLCPYVKHWIFTHEGYEDLVY